MKNRLPRLTLSGQFILLLVVTILVSQALNILFLMNDRKLSIRTNQYAMIIDDIAHAVQNLPAHSPVEYPMFVSRLSSGEGEIFLSNRNISTEAWNAQVVTTEQEKLSKKLSTVLDRDVNAFLITHRLGRRPTAQHEPRPMRPPDSRPIDRGRPPPPGRDEIVASVEVSPGVWLNAMHPHHAVAAFTVQALAATGLTLLAAIAAVILLTRRLVRPIRDLTTAAEQFGRGDNAQRVPVSGPHDIQVAIKAFNNMQESLTRLIETQRSTLRAVGHDLRTPITSLRIRAEEIPQENNRDKFIATLDDLTVMTEEILRWAKDVSSVEEMVAVDLSALVSSISDDYSDQQKDVTFIEPTTTFIVTCRRVALRRAIINLIDNALKYGGCARITLDIANTGFVNINIEDTGPGIPEQKLADVLTPFTRIETSRNRGTGGIGLGLSIVKSVALGHGGDLTLTNLPSGFRASLSLPMKP